MTDMIEPQVIEPQVVIKPQLIEPQVIDLAVQQKSVIVGGDGLVATAAEAVDATGDEPNKNVINGEASEVIQASGEAISVEIQAQQTTVNEHDIQESEQGLKEVDDVDTTTDPELGMVVSQICALTFNDLPFCPQPQHCGVKYTLASGSCNIIPPEGGDPAVSKEYGFGNIFLKKLEIDFLSLESCDKDLVSQPSKVDSKIPTQQQGEQQLEQQQGEQQRGDEQRGFVLQQQLEKPFDLSKIVWGMDYTLRDPAHYKGQSIADIEEGEFEDATKHVSPVFVKGWSESGTTKPLHEWALEVAKTQAKQTRQRALAYIKEMQKKEQVPEAVGWSLKSPAAGTSTSGNVPDQNVPEEKEPYGGPQPVVHGVDYVSFDSEEEPTTPTDKLTEHQKKMLQRKKDRSRKRRKLAPALLEKSLVLTWRTKAIRKFFDPLCQYVLDNINVRQKLVQHESEPTLLQCNGDYVKLGFCGLVVHPLGMVIDQYVRVCSKVYEKMWTKQFGDHARRFMLDPSFVIQILYSLKGSGDAVKKTAKAYTSHITGTCLNEIHVVFVLVLVNSSHWYCVAFSRNREEILVIDSMTTTNAAEVRSKVVDMLGQGNGLDIPEVGQHLGGKHYSLELE